MVAFSRSVSPRKGLLAMAIGLLAAGVHTQMNGQNIMAGLRWHHRTIESSRPSGAAAHKRAAKRLRNVRARASKR